jgi:hypothetical protein
MRVYGSTIVASAAAALLAAACDRAPPQIRVEDAWARATAPAQDQAAVYLRAANDGGIDDRLVEVRSPRSAIAMLHSSSAEAGVSRMRHAAEGLAVPAGGALQLAPGADHVMLSGLTAPLRVGERFPVQLRFETSGHRQVEVDVLPATAEGPEQAR